jgi:hypothetical protein
MEFHTDQGTIYMPQPMLYGPKAETERSKCEADERSPSVKVAPNGDYRVVPEDHHALMSAVGAGDWHFYEGVIKQAVDAGWAAQWGYSEVLTNFILSVVKSIGPRDQVETMIGLQMGAIHRAVMQWTSLLVQADSSPELMEKYGRAVERLVRTFATLVATLKAHRSKGEQKVTVQHVSVEGGAQAIVSQNVSRGRRRRRKRAAAPAAALAQSTVPPMEILGQPPEKEVGAGVPAATGSKQ